jgi:putative ABC transport system ATP-binding protein
MTGDGTADAASSDQAAPSPRRRRPVIAIQRVSKIYGTGDIEVRALQEVSLTIERGDYVAIMGASGSGKSTLMNIIGCLDVPTSGRYLLDGVDVRKLDEFDLAEVRNRKLGFIFQSFNLIPRTTALANVELPLVYGEVKRAERRRRALEALERVGLSDRISHIPSELSGGQQQRVAIARAIVTNPSVMLADEPTGALDSVSTQEVLGIFDQLNVEGRSVVVITHEDEVAAHAKRIVRLKDGRIIDDVRQAPADGLPPRFRGLPPPPPGAAKAEPPTPESQWVQV